MLRDVAAIASLLKDAWLDGSARRAVQQEQAYALTEDPYGSARAEEAVRFRRALELLDRVPRPAARAFEAGCGEGFFTAMLAPRCERLIAADISPTALKRAAERVQRFTHVELRRWDIYRDPVPGDFALIVVLGVFDLVCRPSHMRQIRDKLVAALVPGGHLLIGTSFSPVESKWYGRRFARGRSANRLIAEHPELERVADVSDQAALPMEHVLFRRKVSA